MSYVTNPFEQVRWFLGKNMTSETIPPRACCGLWPSDSPLPSEYPFPYTTFAIDEESDIPYWRLYKPGLFHERCQSPSCIVFNGPEAIPAGKIGRVTRDYPVAALVHGVNGDGIPVGPIANKWFLGRWRDAFRSVGATFDAGEVYDLSTIVKNGPDQDAHVFTCYVTPNSVPDNYSRNATRFRQQTAGAAWLPDMCIWYDAVDYSDITEMVVERPFSLWTGEHPDGDIIGWKINVPGWYSGHASATVSFFQSDPMPWSAGFVWSVLAGDEVADWASWHASIAFSGDPDEIVHTQFIGFRRFWHSAYGGWIQAAENVSVPFLSYLIPGNVVHLRTVGTTLGVSNFGNGSMMLQSEISSRARMKGGTWQEHSHPV
jgi:hypothetical protein